MEKFIASFYNPHVKQTQSIRLIATDEGDAEDIVYKYLQKCFGCTTFDLEECMAVYDVNIIYHSEENFETRESLLN